MNRRNLDTFASGLLRACAWKACWSLFLAMEEEILHEGSMSGAVIYISEFQNKLAWKFGISVSIL